MATDLERLVVTLEAQNAKYMQKMEQSERRVQKFQKQNRRALKGIASDFKNILGAVAVGAFIKKVADAAAEQEDVVRQLEQGLATTGGVVGQSLDELTAKAAELQKATTFGDEELIRAQSQLVTFTNIAGREFDRTIELAADLSIRMGQDLKSSVVQLGKALNDPVANLSALSRTGIQFTDAQKEMIRQLVESGDLLSAQGIILDELQTQFGGSARAARETFGGSLKALKNAAGDLLEGGGGLKDASAEINKLTELLQDPKTVAGADAIATAIIGIVRAAASFATNAAGLTEFLAEGLAAKAFGPAIDDVVRLDDRVEGLKKTIAALEPLSLSRPGDRAIAEQLKDAQAELEKYNSLLALSRKGIGTPQVSGPDTSGIKSLGLIISKDILVDIKAINEAREVQRKLREELEKQGEAIRQSVLTPNELYAQQLKELMSLQDAGVISQETVTRKQAEYKAQLEDSLGITDQYKKAIEIIEETTASIEPKLQSIAEDQSLLNKAYRDGQISADQFAASMAVLDQQILDIQEGTQQTTDQMGEFANQAARNMQDAFADFLFDPFQDGLDGMLKGFLKVIQRMVAEQAAAKIFSSTADGGLGGGDFISGIVGGLLNFEGGGFTGFGPRVGGVDGRGGFLSVMHPNEQVLDLTDGGGSGGISIGQMVFPGVTNEKEARVAAGSAAREINRVIQSSGRYS